MLVSVFLMITSLLTMRTITTNNNKSPRASSLARSGPEVESDQCALAPCKNGGKCHPSVKVKGFDCECPPGFKGTHCEIDIDNCQKNPCEHGATCIDEVNNYRCTCPAGYKGTNCEIDIDDCQENPCKHGATCIDEVNNYRCTCPAGYKGTNCEIDINECRYADCKNGARCIDEVNNYRCKCRSGFKGTNCEIDIDDCQGDPCFHGAKCIDEVNRYRCNCLTGYTGTNCEINIDDCVKASCQNGATCIDQLNAYHCQCPHGYGGDHCELDINQCAKFPCAIGAEKCVDGVSTYFCVCLPDYVGVHCDIGTFDVNHAVESSFSVLAGADIRVKVPVSGSVLPGTFFLFRLGQVVERSKGANMRLSEMPTKGGLVELMLPHADIEDIGQYTLMMVNAHQVNRTFEFSVEVIANPMSMDVENNTYYLLEIGSHHSVRFGVNGDPLPEIFTLKKNGEDLPSNYKDMFVVTFAFYNSTNGRVFLRILDITQDYGGSYTINMADKAGNSLIFAFTILISDEAGGEVESSVPATVVHVLWAPLIFGTLIMIALLYKHRSKSRNIEEGIELRSPQSPAAEDDDDEDDDEDDEEDYDEEEEDDDDDHNDEEYEDYRKNRLDNHEYDYYDDTDRYSHAHYSLR